MDFNLAPWIYSPGPGAWLCAACTWQSQDLDPGAAKVPAKSLEHRPPTLTTPLCPTASLRGCPCCRGLLTPVLCSLPACTAPRGTAPTPGSCPTWWLCAWLPSTPATKSSSTGQSPLPPGEPVWGPATTSGWGQWGAVKGQAPAEGGSCLDRAREVEWCLLGRPQVC